MGVGGGSGGGGFGEQLVGDGACGRVSGGVAVGCSRRRRCRGVIAPKALNRWVVLDDIDQRLAAVDGLVADIAAELVDRIRNLTKRINELEGEIAKTVRHLAPTLLTLAGCGLLSAAKIVAEVAGVDRFKSRAAFARWNGSAPIPVWTGSERFRLNRGGNRQVNAALHRITITQWRGVGDDGRAYILWRLEKGDTKTAAMRALRRRISDEVFKASTLTSTLLRRRSRRCPRSTTPADCRCDQTKATNSAQPPGSVSTVRSSTAAPVAAVITADRLGHGLRLHDRPDRRSTVPPSDRGRRGQRAVGVVPPDGRQDHHSSAVKARRAHRPAA